MKDRFRSIVFHLRPNPGDITRKSNPALGFFQGNFYFVWEAFRAVLCNYGSAAEVVWTPGLYGICSCDKEIISTTDPIYLRILTTTHTWGSNRFCIYIHLFLNG